MLKYIKHILFNYFPLNVLQGIRVVHRRIIIMSNASVLRFTYKLTAAPRGVRNSEIASL